MRSHVVGVSGLAVMLTMAAAPAQAALSGCTMSALNAAAIHGMVFSSAKDVAASGDTPEYCDTLGGVDEAGRRAGFRIQLPEHWNGKLVFYGVGGTGGQVTAPSANAVDMAEALGRGYATAVTDTGHQSASSTDDSFAIISVGVPNGPAIMDYNYAAAHRVTVAAKDLLRAYYAGPVMRAYFDGCSGGGRAALNAAGHYPEDFDGVIAGDPGVGAKFLMTLKSAKAEFDPPAARIPEAMLPVIDKAVYAACDAVDGVKDGLIQNPAACRWKPEALLCKAGQSENCLTGAQVAGLNNYLHPLTDSRGHVFYHGYFPTDLSGGTANFTGYALGPNPVTDAGAAEPWGTGEPARGWGLGDTQLKFFYARDPNYNARSFPVTASGVVDAAAMAAYNAKIRAFHSRDDDPQALAAFLNKGRKLIIYNGFSDPSTSPEETIAYYRKLAALRGGYGKVQKEARLFMVPGMQHCRGGAGPDAFDTLSAIDDWAVKGVAPDGIVATKYVKGAPVRAMKLCRYPEQARYLGGDVNVAASWTCREGDKRLLARSVAASGQP